MKRHAIAGLALGAVIMLSGATMTRAQSASRFDVASVKASKPISMRAGPMLQQSGRLYTINLTLLSLVREAYGLWENQVVGGPPWIDSTGFDVEARAAAGATPAQVRTMLRELLVERFGLATHTEKRQLPIYELTMSARDGKPGPHLRPSGPECADPALPRGGPGAPPPPPPPPPLDGVYLGADRREPMRCPTIFFSGHVSARSITMNGFAQGMERVAGRPVVNRTGLSGIFDLDLSYTPDFDAMAPLSSAAGGRAGGPASGPQTNAPALFTALREQLGLRLESARGPVDVLVIDRANLPTQN